ncbi:MAG: hypothetical protein LBG87_04945 [Spirochaetaceae bacterium]|nr:hypothetical protein [Spirochaetaceae bacterium]
MKYNIKENPDMPPGIRGEFDPITKAIEVKSAEDVAAVVHKMLHQFYLTLTDAEIAGFKKLFRKSDPKTQKKYDPKTRLGAEKFADMDLDYLSRNNMAEIGAQSPVRRETRLFLPRFCGKA